MTGGDFSPEAYQQLRDAYAAERSSQLEAETKGVEVMGQKMTLETLPVDSPWADKIQNWEYPNGKSAYLDGKQSPEEILEIMRGAAQEKVDAQAEAEAEAVTETTPVEPPDVDGMSDEEFDAYIDELISDESLEEISDEELEAFMDDLLTEGEEEVKSGDEDLDDLRAQIAQLRAELAELSSEDEVDEEEESEEEPEEEPEEEADEEEDVEEEPLEDHDEPD